MEFSDRGRSKPKKKEGHRRSAIIDNRVLHEVTLVDLPITQGMSQTGNNIPLQQAEEQVAESSNTQDGEQQAPQRLIQSRKRKWKESQETEASLTASLEIETSDSEDIQTKLQEAMAEQNKLRKQLENYKNELQLQMELQRELANAHAAEKQTLVKELQTVEKEKCDIAKLVQNKFLLQEEKMQEALIEQNKLKKQAENVEREFHSQKNELTRIYAEEKKMLIDSSITLLIALIAQNQTSAAMLQSMRQREAGLVNDSNKTKEELTNRIDNSKNLENKFSHIREVLDLTNKQNESLQHKLKALQRENEIEKRKNTRMKVPTSTMSLNDNEAMPSTTTRSEFEQEAEVTSVRKKNKFFVSKTPQPYTYKKRKD